ncbi:tetratricopeptide (TPR) repeat protein [Pedobacter sp. AK017]|uniref:RagB/SusD family nutrient uptake outer membrane protein n=1 Tax=Pedobacter sp. AK017 TaxID=2723073 RepID=UPI00161DB591|nr:RagB/SusD family nutrient uptake outer membrane protein [Pedobacter sp. AK017]MBB5439512.1 tetratricopeptide (TPR) repeat protein [Pedobacter sp. AK017]
MKKINDIKALQIAILTLSVITCSLQSCKEDWLEVKQDKKLAIPSTVRDFQSMLDNPSLNSNYALVLGEIASDGHYYTIANYIAMGPSSYYYMQNAYTWTTIQPFESRSEYSSIYSVPYAYILKMNIILDEAQKSSDNDKAGLEQVKAQALFHRGLNFFNLAQVFADVYKPSDAQSHLGLALRLSTDINEPSVRSSLKRTYEQIISDLTRAKEILPDNPEVLTRPSKSAALAILAKIYLSMGDYQNAIIHANDYLKIKNELLDYSTISQSANYIGINKEVAFIDFLARFSQVTTQYLINQDLYDSFDLNDLRKKIFFKLGTAGIQFKGTYGSAAADVFSGVATDEIYLIRAECYARTGNVNLAMKDLNDLVRTRWAKNSDGSSTYTDRIALDETDALRKIFIERKKQLILRGVRWTDIRRLNQEPRFAVTLTRTIDNKQYTLEPTSLRYTFPFPAEAIQRSTMQQNPGW